MRRRRIRSAPRAPQLSRRGEAAAFGDMLHVEPRLAEQLARAGIEVVQDRCLLVELRRLGR